MPDAILDRSEAGPAGKPPKRRWRRLLGSILFVLVAAVACSFLAVEATEQFAEPQACAKCHEMADACDSWVRSPHYVNPSGVRVTCVACHLPPREDHIAHLTSKAWHGAKNVYVHFFGEYDAEAARRGVLESMPTRRCIRCHDNLLAKPASSAIGAVHRVSIEQAPQRGYACVACHDDLHGAKQPKEIVKEIAYEVADNSYCYVCHDDYDGEEFTGMHKAVGVACTACHGDSEKHADDEEHLTAPSVMYPGQTINASCTSDECHSETLLKKHRGHRPFYAGAESNRKYCTDCHGKHRLDKRTRTWNKTTGKLTWTDGESKADAGMSGP